VKRKYNKNMRIQKEIRMRWMNKELSQRNMMKMKKKREKRRRRMKKQRRKLRRKLVEMMKIYKKK